MTHEKLLGHRKDTSTCTCRIRWDDPEQAAHPDFTTEHWGGWDALIGACESDYFPSLEIPLCSLFKAWGMPSTLSSKFLQSTSPKVKLKALCDLSLKYHGLVFLSRGLRILKVTTLKYPDGSEGGRPVTPNPILLLCWEKEKTSTEWPPAEVMLCFTGQEHPLARPCQAGVLGCRINGRSVGGTCTGAGYPGKNHAAQWVGRESLQFHVKCKEIFF